ncbi:hypothetical protein M9458_034919, partial [Cirrhinus mrigala]
MYEMPESRCTSEESTIPHCPCKMLQYGRTPHLGSTLWPALPQALSLARSLLLDSYFSGLTGPQHPFYNR